MANDTNIKSRFFGPNAGNTQITAASDTTLAAEQDPADGADLTLTTAAGNDSICGPGFSQQVKLVSGTGDDNSDVTYTIIGTDVNGASQTEDLTGPAGGASVVSTLFYRTLTKVTGNGAASVDISKFPAAATPVKPLTLVLPVKTGAEKTATVPIEMSTLAAPLPVTLVNVL